MILSYLILSKDYYGDMTIDYNNKLYNTFMSVFKNKNIEINFASFRYDNTQTFRVNEYFNLLQFLHICILNGTIPILNISNAKIETILLLYIHGFFVGIHFKEKEINLLQNGICNDLITCFDLIRKNNLYINTISNISLLFNNLYDSFFNKYNINIKNSTFFCNILKKLSHDRELLETIYTPFKQAIEIYKQKYFVDIDSINNLDRKKYKHPLLFFSSHNLIDFKRALEFGVNYVTISPIFYDKINKALGMNFLVDMPQELKQYAFALGGIDSNEKIKFLLENNIAGFASIRYFLNYI